MHSSQRLFMAAGTGTGDLLAHESFLDRARQERERNNDQAARCALGAYLVARLADRMVELHEAPSDEEAFSWQVEGCRRFVMDLEDVPEVSHLRGIIDAIVADAMHRPAKVRVSLTAYAYYLEHEGRWAEALDMLAIAGRVWGKAIPSRELASLSLFAGRLNRLLARWDKATDAYTVAEEAALSVRDTFSAMRARLGRGAVMRGQGNLPLARAAAERVIADCTDPELADVQAMAYADLGAVLARQGLRVESLNAMYQAYVCTHDSSQRIALLGDLGVALAELGSAEEAKCALEMVLESEAGFQLKMNARLELMDLASACSNRMSFERYRSEARRELELMPPSMRADCGYKVAIGLSRFGQQGRARAQFQETLAFTELYQLNEWYFKVDKALSNIDACVQGTEVNAGDEDLRLKAAVETIGAGLQESRELARA